MKFDLKKFLILNFPYALMFWFFNRAGEGYRLAAGADMVTICEKPMRLKQQAH